MTKKSKSPLSEFHVKVGARIREFREASSLSSRDRVYKKTGIGTTTIYEAEKGVTDVGIGTLETLCRAYGKTLGELFEPWLEQYAIKSADEELFIYLREILGRNTREADAMRLMIAQAWAAHKKRRVRAK